MYDLPKTLDQFCKFLGVVPGVKVLSRHLSEGSAQIELTASGETAVLALQHMAMGANVSLQPWLRRAALEGIGGRPIEQVFVARTVRRDHFKFGELQMLGVWLIWHLHKVGALPSEAANVQLHYWQGFRVGA